MFCTDQEPCAGRRFRQSRRGVFVASGLDYPSVGPEHAYLRDIGRVNYVTVTDREAVEAFRTLSVTEGIIPALESAHAVAYALKLAKELGKGEKYCRQSFRPGGIRTWILFSTGIRNFVSGNNQKMRKLCARSECSERARAYFLRNGPENPG